MYATAVFTTIVILLSLIFLNNFEKLFTKGNRSIVIEIIALPGLQVTSIVAALEKFNLSIKSVEIVKVENNLRNIFIKVKRRDRKSTRLNSSHVAISYAVFCLKKKII